MLGSGCLWYGASKILETRNLLFSLNQDMTRVHLYVVWDGSVWGQRIIIPVLQPFCVLRTLYFLSIQMCTTDCINQCRRKIRRNFISQIEMCCSRLTSFSCPSLHFLVSSNPWSILFFKISISFSTNKWERGVFVLSVYGLFHLT